MSWWQGFQFYRLREAPAGDPPSEGRREGRRDAHGLLAAALMASHASLRSAGGSPALATAWVQSPWDPQLHVLLGGRPYLPFASLELDQHVGRTRGVLFPPGALVSDVTTPDAVALLESLPLWVACTGRFDPLWGPDGASPEPARRRGAFDQYAAHWGSPFAWVVLAEPLVAGDLQDEVDLLVQRILPLSRAEVGEAARLDLERARARHRELSRIQPAGAWRIRVLVGGVDAAGAERAAAILCAAAELDGLPYALTPAGRATDFSRAVEAAQGGADGGSPAFAASTELLAALSRPPERELPGVRVVTRAGFDVTPEGSGATGIQLGAVLEASGAEVGSLWLRASTINRHAFVCGATGGGKSMTVRHLLTELSRAGVPWLVIEPAKAEYARMAGRLAALGQSLTVLRPGDPSGPPAGFNPLAPSAGFPLQTHSDLVGALFMAAFEAHEPFPQILRAALTRVYTEAGWDLSTGLPLVADASPGYPSLGDLQRVALQVVAEIGYAAEATADVTGFIRVRINSLRLGTTGRFFEGGHPLNFDRLLSRNVVLEIEDVGDDQDKAFLMGAVLIRLTEHLRMAAKAAPDPPLSHVTVIEEAHRLLRASTSPRRGGSDPVEMFASMLAEVRAYGEGLIIAEQIPSKLITDVIKNTALKIVHRLPAKDDRDTVGATMNLAPDQSTHVVALQPGIAAVHSDGMDRPLLLRIPNGTTDEQRAGTLDPVSALIGRRSPTCCGACRAEPCTLLHVREAQHLLTQRPGLVLLAELTVVAHLVGVQPPTVARGWPELLTGDATERVLGCALSQAVDAAVAVRAALLPRRLDPAQLAAHCMAVANRQLFDTAAPDPCAEDDHAFLADHFRWLRPLVALTRDDDTDEPHPLIAEWERRLMTVIPGFSRADQLAFVTARFQDAYADGTARDRVVFGTLRPSALEGVVGAEVGKPDWAGRARAALGPIIWEQAGNFLHLDPTN